MFPRQQHCRAVDPAGLESPKLIHRTVDHRAMLNIWLNNMSHVKFERLPNRKLASRDKFTSRCNMMVVQHFLFWYMKSCVN